MRVLERRPACLRSGWVPEAAAPRAAWVVPIRERHEAAVARLEAAMAGASSESVLDVAHAEVRVDGAVVSLRRGDVLPEGLSADQRAVLERHGAVAQRPVAGARASADLAPAAEELGRVLLAVLDVAAERRDQLRRWRRVELRGDTPSDVRALAEWAAQVEPDLGDAAVGAGAENTRSAAVRVALQVAGVALVPSAHMVAGVV